MSQARVMVRFEKSLAVALTATDPVRAVRRMGRDSRLPMKLRRTLRKVRGPNIEMAACSSRVYVSSGCFAAALRQKRGSRRTPPPFAVAFRRYHAEVRPTAFFPPDEAILFRAWDRRTSRFHPQPSFTASLEGARAN